MASIKEWLAALFRGLERKLGIDREGRTVWVWLMPPGIGVASAVLMFFMPGLPDNLNWTARLPFAVFALITMTLIASIYLIQFDNDHNQQAAVDDDPGRGDDGPETPPVPSGSPPPGWIGALRPVNDEPTPDADHAGEGTRREPVPVGAAH
jgi:hypothetical protein